MPEPSLHCTGVPDRRTSDSGLNIARAVFGKIQDENLARLPPLEHRNLNVLGRYLFNIKASGPGQGLRPIRDPGVAEKENDDSVDWLRREAEAGPLIRECAL